MCLPALTMQNGAERVRLTLRRSDCEVSYGLL